MAEDSQGTWPKIGLRRPRFVGVGEYSRREARRLSPGENGRHMTELEVISLKEHIFGALLAAQGARFFGTVTLKFEDGAVTSFDAEEKMRFGGQIQNWARGIQRR